MYDLPMCPRQAFVIVRLIDFYENTFDEKRGFDGILVVWLTHLAQTKNSKIGKSSPLDGGLHLATILPRFPSSLNWIDLLFANAFCSIISQVIPMQSKVRSRSLLWSGPTLCMTRIANLLDAWSARACAFRIWKLCYRAIVQSIWAARRVDRSSGMSRGRCGGLCRIRLECFVVVLASIHWRFFADLHTISYRSGAKLVGGVSVGTGTPLRQFLISWIQFGWTGHWIHRELSTITCRGKANRSRLVGMN